MDLRSSLQDGSSQGDRLPADITADQFLRCSCALLVDAVTGQQRGSSQRRAVFFFMISLTSLLRALASPGSSRSLHLLADELQVRACCSLVRAPIESAQCAPTLVNLLVALLCKAHSNGAQWQNPH
jgi:hypothetical protein